MRPTAIRGDAAVAYYDSLVADPRQLQSGRGVEDYYLSTDELPGVWWGAAAAELGLVGESSRENFHALLDGLHPRTGERLGQRLRPDGVRGFDLTFSAPKSVSVLSAVAGGEIERAVIAAHDAAVRAVLGLIEERATTRTGRNGVYRIDVTGLAALLVRHRTSRTLDPQLHTHAVVAAKVKGVDGCWRSVDAAFFYRDQRALGALYQAALRAELTGRLGVRWGEVVKGQAELRDVPQALCEVFSRRSVQVRELLAQRLREFRAEHGREPGPREHAILARDAARASRPGKQRGRDASELRSEWLATASEHGFTPALLGARFSRPPAQVGEAGRSAAALQAGSVGDGAWRDRLAREVVGALAGSRSAWARADVLREVCWRLPVRGGQPAVEQVREVEALAGWIVERWCVDLAPGWARGVAREQVEEVGVERFSTVEVVACEQRCVRWMSELAACGGRPADTGRLMRAAERTGVALDPEQALAAALVAGSAHLVVVIGPAGAGKTTAMRGAVAAVRDAGGQVIGLAPSAAAAEQLQKETGVRSETVARFLTVHEHAAAEGSLDVPAGATVIVDEASMLSTPDCERLLAVVRDRGLRLALVGDGRQLAAVGRGGMFDHARQIASTMQLREVRRFTERWEQHASLRLRQCDPGSLTEYAEHGRVRAGSAQQMSDAILDDWWTAVQAGRRAAFSVPTNEQARELSARARARLIDAGTVDDARVVETRAGERIGRGDQIQTRLNDRAQQTASGAWVKNRQRWQVLTVHPDGGLSVRKADGDRGRLTPAYVAEHVELAYFTTVHGTQGLTRDIGGTLVDELAGFRSLYVGMTRGRQRNTAYVVLRDGEETDTAREALERALRRDRADLGALMLGERLSQDARRLSDHRARELETEHSLITSNPDKPASAQRARLDAIASELAQLRPPAQSTTTAELEAKVRALRASVADRRLARAELELADRQDELLDARRASDRHAGGARKRRLDRRVNDPSADREHELLGTTENARLAEHQLRQVRAEHEQAIRELERLENELAKRRPSPAQTQALPRSAAERHAAAATPQPPGPRLRL